MSDYEFAEEMAKTFRRQQPLSALKKWPSNWEFLSPEKSLIFIETHLTERTMYPNGQEIGNITLTAKERKTYLMALCFMLATNYGTPRLLSSYEFYNRDQGPPTDQMGKIKSPMFDWMHQCSSGDYRCQHRYPEVQRMVRFRQTVAGGALNNWADNGVDQVAFCVGNGGFVAFNGYNLAKFDAVLQVCLPEGTYCDVITGKATELGCSGEEVIVNKTGHARIVISGDSKVGVLAIHVGERVV